MGAGGGSFPACTLCGSSCTLKAGKGVVGQKRGGKEKARHRVSGVRGAEGHVQRHSQGQHVDVINSRPQSGNSLQKPGAADALETW